MIGFVEHFKSTKKAATARHKESMIAYDNLFQCLQKNYNRKLQQNIFIILIYFPFWCNLIFYVLMRRSNKFWLEFMVLRC